MRNIYQVRSEFKNRLTNLPGLQIIPESRNYITIKVFRNLPSVYLDNGYLHLPSRLPQHCDEKLVCHVLRQLEQNKIADKELQLLETYIQLAKNKDDNIKLKANIKTSLSEIARGVVKILAGVGIFFVMLLLAGLAPIAAPWIALLLIPAIAIPICGVVNLLLGMCRLIVGILAVCFQKSDKDLPHIQSKLDRLYHQEGLPSYEEAVKKNSPSAPCELLPPNYEQAIKNIPSIAQQGTPLSSPVSAPAVVLVSPPPVYTPAVVTLASNPAQIFYVNNFSPINGESYTLTPTMKTH